MARNRMIKGATVVLAVGLTGLLASAGLASADQTYKVTGMYEADDQGRVLSQNVSSGRIVLREDKTYLIELHVKDQGTFRYVKANPQQPSDMIYFDSVNKYRYFAYPGENILTLWLHKNARGANVWIRAELAVEPKPEPEPGKKPSGIDPPPKTKPKSAPESGAKAEPEPSSGVIPGMKAAPAGLIQNGVFSKTLIYGNTSAPTYFREDRATRELSADEKGIVFRPDGTYSLRAEMGSSLMKENGRYAISGEIVRIVFSDASFIDLKLMNGGQALYWYVNGMLISEFYFWGIVNNK